ncbi:MgtC/SapB transporter [Beutenbergia cavernae DSM 12333]|uniref:MgtC/SapB transporter n=1 Tax=Beutenbergia cavernae (strain ATCC BAA-8 / DSM 12333 / CCUG 43141 / JCM 11478 / NBRC 16432 / NCIMB 13614 / HKI 0122) TaxID=471853 RepID=C5BZB2_BEUC1|nr:MgtC/SapB family protein [Beutenbergia cavernae]ACQ79084.1 MgtC/SapB transporter [Beutenbergia cavernae DSM 12333]
MGWAWASETTVTELQLLGLAFVLCSIIGLERQFHQKSAGLRTHTLVGMGAAVFTLISAYGFAHVLGADVTLDPSRIAAQIVSGIGFLGAGVIFMRRDIVRGLTTAATIWVSAAVGMACGAGMPVLAIATTGLHLAAIFVLAPIGRALPTPDRRRLVAVRYRDGEGVLRSVLATATDMGFQASIISTSVDEQPSGARVVAMTVRFRGRTPLRDLVTALAELSGVVGVQSQDDETEDDD